MVMRINAYTDPVRSVRSANVRRTPVAHHVLNVVLNITSINGNLPLKVERVVKVQKKNILFTNLAYLERIHPSGKNVTLGKEPPFRVCHDVIYIHTYIYNIAFANSER